MPVRAIMPPKRGRAAAEDETEAHRRTKSAINEAVSEFVCPISCSYPVNPVTAEDGNVYERSAIEEWLEKHQRSPLTNEPMGTKLLPALRVKNMIRTMVASGALTGDKVDAWREMLAQEERVAEQRRCAEAGDGAAMYILGGCYEFGLQGLGKDAAKAAEWYKKSDEAGDASGTCGLGRCYLYGTGVSQCHSRAAVLLGDAARAGSQNACLYLGRCFADGSYGFPKDKEMARRYYSMVTSALVKDSGDSFKEEAAAWLQAHPA